MHVCDSSGVENTKIDNNTKRRNLEHIIMCNFRFSLTNTDQGESQLTVVCPGSGRAQSLSQLVRV